MWIRDQKQVLQGKRSLRGSPGACMDFLEKEQLLDRKLWARFVDQFRDGVDAENQGWRGEYWGKMMRGGAMVCAVNHREELYQVLTESVKDMLTVMEPDGRVSSYAREGEFDSWDLWSRKYVMLGMLYYYDICKDEALRQEILEFLCRLLDYVIAHIGEGKKRITAASRSWMGINSSSILEPVVWLYRLTGEQRYLAFAAYIVKEGGAQDLNIFKLALENKLYPYQYGVSKAYEMMSCFEGLLEYARITGEEQWKQACIHFGRAILDSDVSVIGSCGCTHELLDHSKLRQTAFYDGVMQETCVTVTWMKLCGQLLRLTGDSVFADAMEQSFYNAYLGAMNTERKDCPYIKEKFVEKQGVTDLVYTFLPVDSYSPLRAGKRGVKVGGSQLLPGHSYYGCCTCIAAAGVGVFASHSVLAREDGLSVEFYEPGEQQLFLGEREIRLEIETAYPVEGRIRIRVSGAKGLKLWCRIPAWSGEGGYRCFELKEDEESFELFLAMELKEVKPIPWERDVIVTDMSKRKPGWHSAGPMEVFHQPEEDDFVAFTRGPLTLCADSRTGKPAGSVFRFASPTEATVSVSGEIVPGVPCMLRCELRGGQGERIALVDYASAGRDWKTEIAAWMRVK